MQKARTKTPSRQRTSKGEARRLIAMGNRSKACRQEAGPCWEQSERMEEQEDGLDGGLGQKASEDCLIIPVWVNVSQPISSKRGFQNSMLFAILFGGRGGRKDWKPLKSLSTKDSLSGEESTE